MPNLATPMNEHPKRPILCGTDFSEPATQAANVAAAFAQRLGAPLLLVHGVDERGDIPSRYWPGLIEELRPRLGAEAERLRLLGAKVEETLAGGVPDDGVAKCAEQADARLIVLGSSGLGSVGRWILGSVSERIAEAVWVPTLVLRESARIGDWARGGAPLRVFVGADFTPVSDGALTWAAELREIGPCEFTVGYVDRMADERAEQALHAPPDTPRAPEMQEMLSYDLRQKAAGFFSKEHLAVHVLPATGPVEVRLLELVAEARADLIVIGTHQWHGRSRLRHASVSRRVLHTAPVSVACVPAHRVVSVKNAPLPQVGRVLVATDLSTHGSQAVPHAFSLLPAGGAVRLVHVAEPGQAQEPLLARLRELIPAEAARPGLHAEVKVIAHRHAAEAICDAAERFEADVICIGSHGQTGLAATLLGSVAQAVVSRSTRPVLVVPIQPA